MEYIHNSQPGFLHLGPLLFFGNRDRGSSSCVVQEMSKVPEAPEEYTLKHGEGGRTFFMQLVADRAILAQSHLGKKSC